MSLKNIYLIVGPSGSGKTTLADILAARYNFKVVESYTTRPRRYPEETGHIFVSDEEFDALGPLCAYTEYNGYRYGVTNDIIDTHDIYVIDPFGAKMLLETYKGQKKIKLIRIDASNHICEKHMRIRGDDEESIKKRIQQDRKSFGKTESDIRYDLILPVSYLSDMVECASYFMKCCEHSKFKLR